MKAYQSVTMKKLAGIHTPLLTSFLIKHIELQTGLSFMDSSYPHDELDSIMNEALNLQIFIPNSIKGEYQDGKIETFAVREIDEDEDDLLITVSITAVFDFVTKWKRRTELMAVIPFCKTRSEANEIQESINQIQL